MSHNGIKDLSDISSSAFPHHPACLSILLAPLLQRARRPGGKGLKLLIGRLYGSKIS